MSKTMLRDDDVIEIMDFLFNVAEHSNNMKDVSTAEYLFGKMAVASGRNESEYYKLLQDMEKEK